MKILQVNTSDTGGGAEKVAYQIYQKLDSFEQVNSYFFVGEKRKQEERIFTVKKNLLENIKTKIIRQLLGLHPLGNKHSHKIVKIVNKDYDIIHYHNLHGNYFDLKLIQSIEIPAVWTLHDMWALTGRCAYSLNCEGWKNKCGICQEQLDSYPKMYFDNSTKCLNLKNKIIHNSKLHIVTPSYWLERIVRQSQLKDLNIRTIPNGVDLDIYKVYDKDDLRKKYGLDKNKKYILFLSANIDDPRKGFKDFIQSLEKIERKSEYTLLIAGKEMNQSLLNEEFEVKQFGYITDENVLNQIYSMADIFIVPTFADNFPCTILESMASGTPVLSYNVGGINEQITEDCGWLIEPGNLNDLTEILNNLDDKVKLKIMGEKARKRVEENFSLDKCVQSYLELYSEILDCGK